MRRKNRTHLALGLMLMAVIAGTCTVVYQSGSKSVPNEKEFVLNEGDSIDEAMKTEEKEITEENRNSETQDSETQDSETQNPEAHDVNTSQVEGERVIEEGTKEPENADEAEQNIETQIKEEESVETQTEAVQSIPEVNFTESSLMQWPVEGQVLLDYNMDHTIYFPTLNEYRYSPAIAVSL